jgi:hypothetical protein
MNIIVLVITSFIFIGLFYLSGFIVKTKLKPIIWEEAKEIERNRDIANENTMVTGNTENMWLFAGPIGTKNQTRHHKIVHSVVYFPRRLLLYTIHKPALFFKILRSKIVEADSFNPNINDEKIYNLFTESQLINIAEYCGNNKLTLKIPDDLPLTTTFGLKPAGFYIELDVSNKKILVADLRGTNLLGDNDMIACVLVHLIAHWLHPFTHISCEKSAREIAKINDIELEKSIRYVIPLHDHLIYEKRSPLVSGHSSSTEVKRDTVFKTLLIEPKFIWQEDKKIFKYYKFQIEAKNVLASILEKFNKEVNLENFFQNSIVHSVDHYVAYKRCNDLVCWTIDGSKSKKSYFKSQNFIQTYTRHYATILEEERIGKLNSNKYPLYSELYNRLAKLDKEYADNITCSTSV